MKIRSKCLRVISIVLCAALLCTALSSLSAGAAVNGKPSVIQAEFKDIPLAKETDFYTLDMAVAREYVEYGDPKYTNLVSDGADGAVITGYKGSASEIRIPDTIGGKPVIGITNCFENNGNIKALVLPDSLIYAAEDAFSDCENLERIHLGSLRFGLGYRGISGLLSNCRKLRVLSTSDCADFEITYESGCYGSYGNPLFYRETVDSLEKIYIGSGMKNVGEELFYGNHLKYVEVGDGNPALSSADGVVLNADKTELLVCGTAFESSSFVVPSTVKKISGYAFESCSNLRKITIHPSVTEISDGAFMDCENLTIYGKTDSAAHVFAREKGFDFVDSDYVAETSVTISKTTASLKIGQKLQLTAHANPANAFYKEINWSSSDSSVAVVRDDGTVIAKAEGTATVTASSRSGKTAKCAVTVKGDATPKPDPDLVPTPLGNLSHTRLRNTYLEPTDDGYMRVYCDGSKVGIEYYKSDFSIVSEKSLKLELPIWGGFYQGKDAYYIVEGQNNKECVDGTEVIRIIKYDKNWKRLGAGKIEALEGWDYEIRYPFNVGCVSMKEYGGKLYLITGREGYVDPSVGQGHQGSMMIRMDEKTMETKVVWGNFYHSFWQYIDGTDDFIYDLELSEGGRCTLLKKYDTNNDSVRWSIPTLEYGGTRTSVWSIPCYASVDDIAVTGDKVFGIGTSIDQSLYDNYDWDTTAYNIYLSITPKDSFDKDHTNLVWLTNHKDDGHIFYFVYIVKVNDNRLLVIWQDWEPYTGTGSVDDPLDSCTLHYRFIDSNGSFISEEFTQKAPCSQCKPVCDGSKIVFCSSENRALDFYTINAYTGAFTKRVYKFPFIGDVNGDSCVNSKDRVILTRFLAKWKDYGKIDEKAADVNADGVVNTKDRIIFARYLANWEGYETLPKK